MLAPDSSSPPTSWANAPGSIQQKHDQLLYATKDALAQYSSTDPDHPYVQPTKHKEYWDFIKNYESPYGRPDKVPEMYDFPRFGPRSSNPGEQGVRLRDSQGQEYQVTPEYYKGLLESIVNPGPSNLWASGHTDVKRPAYYGLKEGNDERRRRLVWGSMIKNRPGARRRDPRGHASYTSTSPYTQTLGYGSLSGIAAPQYSGGTERLYPNPMAQRTDAHYQTYTPNPVATPFGPLR